MYKKPNPNYFSVPSTNRLEAIDMPTLEIYYSDLVPEAQARALEAAGIRDPKEANWDMDIIPVAIVELDDGHDE